MKNVAACSKVFWLFVVIFFASLSGVQAQDLFAQMDQVKKELSDLKNQVQDLRNLVFEMRKVMLHNVAAQSPKPETKAPPKQEAKAKPVPIPDEEELTKIICKAVGDFFQEVEAVMSGSEASSAEAGMDKASKKLASRLQPYSGTHRASKLLNIYEGLAWDTYTAVQLSQSVAGNEDFIKVLAKHKQKYVDTCPKR